MASHPGFRVQPGAPLRALNTLKERFAGLVKSVDSSWPLAAQVPLQFPTTRGETTECPRPCDIDRIVFALVRVPNSLVGPSAVRHANPVSSEWRSPAGLTGYASS